MWTAPDGNVFECAQGEKKLDLWYFFKGLKGEASLKKKK
jgi:hypothetical protein